MTEAVRYCPRCHAANIATRTECASCGKSLPLIRREDNADRSEMGTCAHPACRHPGSISDSRLGGGPWWCRGHFFTRTGAAADEIARDSVNKFRNTREEIET